MNEGIDATCSHDTCKAKGEYVLKGYCRNCSWKGDVKLTRGHEFPYTLDCPNCGCMTVKQDHGWSA